MSNCIEIYIYFSILESLFKILDLTQNPFLSTFWRFCDAGSHLVENVIHFLMIYLSGSVFILYADLNTFVICSSMLKSK